YCALFLHCSLLPPLLPFPYTPPFRSEQAGLAASFDVIVVSHFEGVEKPHPEIFRRALARLGVPAAAAAFVGDIWSIDVEGSRARSEEHTSELQSRANLVCRLLLDNKH